MSEYQRTTEFVVGPYRVEKLSAGTTGAVASPAATESVIRVTDTRTGNVVALYERTQEYRDVKQRAAVVNRGTLYRSPEKGKSLRQYFRALVMDEFGIDVGR